MVQIRYRLLGAFEVRVDGRPVALRGEMRCGVLAALLLAAPRGVPLEQLVQDLWWGDPPKSSVNLVHGYVSDWRSALDPDRLRRSPGHHLLTVPGGYRLDLGTAELDVAQFSAGVSAGRAALDAGDLDGAAASLTDALSQWRGPALQSLVGTPMHARAAATLDGARIDAVELLADVYLRQNRADLVLPLLTEAVVEHSMRERLTELRMLALYRLGRQAEALSSYEHLRSQLREELGVEPAAPAREMHLRLLRQDPTLNLDGDAAVHAVGSRMPLPLSSFVGRDAELAAVGAAHRAGHRLLTLVGPAGSGKTRLAVQVALTAEADLGKAAAFVDLSALSSAAQVLPAVARALGLPDLADGTPGSSLAARLGERPVLAVLDNVEHVLAAAGDIAGLVATAPGLTVLATSREPLGISGELMLAVEPLPVPARGEQDPAPLRASAAVQLFTDRVRAASGLVVAEGDLPVVGGICRRLDGLPLALELAAPWTRTLGLRALLEQLDHATDMLAGDHPDRPTRHHTLRSAVDWSWRGLTPAQRAFFARLSVLESPAALHVVRKLADEDDAVVQLRALVEKNLVVHLGSGEESRYLLLSTLREYAAYQLALQPDQERIARDRHAFVVAEEMATVSQAASPVRAGQAFDDDLSEVGAALDHLRASEQHELRLAVAVDTFAVWWDRGRLSDGLDQLHGALSAAEVCSSPRLQAAAHVGCAHLSEALGRYSTALAHARMGARLAHEAGDVAMQACATYSMGDLVMWTQPEEGRRLLEEAMTLGSAAPAAAWRWHWAAPAVVVAGSAYSLAESLRFRDPSRAKSLLIEHLTNLPQPDRRGTGAFLQRSLGFLAIDRGDWLAAERWLELSLDGACRAGSSRGEARSHQGLADLAWARGDLTASAAHAGLALQLSREAGHAYNLARAAARLAEAELDRDGVDVAERVLADAWHQVAEEDGEAADKLLAPARARVARLIGDADTARHLLARADLAQPVDELRPERVTYFLEQAALALTVDRTATLSVLHRLLAEADTIGLVLAVPDLTRVEQIRSAACVAAARE